MQSRTREARGSRFFAFGFLAAALALAPAAFAQTWSEVGDAGDLVGTAQTTAGTGSLSSIAGVLSGHGDVDVYCIQLTAVPPVGLPLVSVACAGHADPTPYLFNAAGMGLNTNMTCSGALKEAIAPPASLAPGQYFVAIAFGDWLPQSAGGNIWQLLFSGPMGPNGPGAGSPLTGWAGPSSVAAPTAYTLILNPNFTGYCDAATTVETSSWGSLKARFGN